MVGIPAFGVLKQCGVGKLFELEAQAGQLLRFDRGSLARA